MREESFLMFNRLGRAHDPKKLRGLVTFLNPSSFLRLKRLDVASEFDEYFVDGISMVVLLRLFGMSVRRFSFDMTSVAPTVFEHAVHDDKSLCLVGGRSDEMVKFVEALKSRYSGIRVLDSSSGYFPGPGDRERCIENIARAQPDIVVVGMGAGLQECFLRDLRSAGWDGRGYTCGAFFSQGATSELEYYPRWIDRCHLRWLYRVWKQPELARRYFLIYPLGALELSLDLLRYRTARLFGFGSADQRGDYSP